MKNHRRQRSSPSPVGCRTFFFFFFCLLLLAARAAIVVLGGFAGTTSGGGTTPAAIRRRSCRCVFEHSRRHRPSPTTTTCIGAVPPSRRKDDEREATLPGPSQVASQVASQLGAPSASAEAPPGTSDGDGGRRRDVLRGILSGGGAAAVAAASSVLSPGTARAGKPELDSATGQLYSPKIEMLSGGSDAARGIPASSMMEKRQKLAARPGQALQTVYGTRFIAYLSRFLLNFDPSAHAWWVKRALGGEDTWDAVMAAGQTGTAKTGSEVENAFAEYAESVEVGLADYFVGPYGSYSSLPAMKAGLFASQPAPSKRAQQTKRGLIQSVLSGGGGGKNGMTKDEEISKQGILNLYTLLKARYGSIAAKRQLAILFSFINNPKLQPVQEISALLGEADNTTVTKVELIKSYLAVNEVESRTSSRRGGGYSFSSFPKVLIEPPPALGDDYREAKVERIMERTTRVLRIQVTDSGEGYESPPQVRVVQSGTRRTCQAAAILDRTGRVESVLVLDPGYGYGGMKGVPPKVDIQEPPRRRGKDPKTPRRAAKAFAELEYEIVGVSVIEGGNGYAKTEPPRVKITPPEEDPDWFIAVQEQPEMRMIPVSEDLGSLKAQVVEMRFPDGNVAYSLTGVPTQAEVDDDLILRLQRDPLELIPTSIRPELRIAPTAREIIYTIPSMDSIPQYVYDLSPRYRAYDPVFGGVGKVPVQKGALELKPSEYGRLALSGAVCTVLVRTALNPLELIKTKQQLLNDEELLTYARRKKASAIPPSSEQPAEPEALSASFSLTSPVNKDGATAVAESPTDTAVLTEASEDSSKKAESVGTLDLLRALAELRGPLSLFQSADITFLASLVFGSFGFGATELFRRSFTASFFTSSESGTGSEVILLLAAALATVVTAAAASPFEVLRVRSMGLLESTKWTNVLRDFLNDGSSDESEEEEEDFDLTKLKPQELLPLWSGFAPTLSRELPFAIAKFLTFDLIAKTIVALLNGRSEEGALPIQVGVGPLGLAISAFAGAVAGIAGAIVSHPADLILTKTSARRRGSGSKTEGTDESGESESGVSSSDDSGDWRAVVQDLISKDGGIANLFVGLGARSIFFFLVIGLQFFLYDYVKNLFQVSSDDLDLVLDVFYAVRAGLPE